MITKEVLPEKGLLKKAATITRFEHLPLGSELTKQPSIAEKQYQNFDDKEPTIKDNKQARVLEAAKLLIC